MRWENLRRSENNERRRGDGGKGVAMGGGIGAIIMAAIAIFFLKQDPSAVISQMGQGQGQQGDDTLQRKATGRTQPETFNHGTSQQRLNWFIKGIKTGDPQEGDTFSIPYSQL